MGFKTRLAMFLAVVAGLSAFAYIYSNYQNPTGNVVLETRRGNVSRVNDGDTLEFEDGEEIRLMGVNAPEKRQGFGYEGAKSFLEKLTGKEVEMKDMGKERYGRTLGYIFSDGRNVNMEILERGLGHLYYYDKDEFFDKMKNSEEQARNQGLGIWKKSSRNGLVELILLDYASDEEKIVLENYGEKFDAVLKDDSASHIYKIVLEKGRYEKNFSKIWNDDHDSLYLWDEEGLILFYRYGNQKIP